MGTKLTFACRIRCVLSHTLSIGRLAAPVAHDAGGSALGSASGEKLTPENVCNNRTRNTDTSLYANCRNASVSVHQGHWCSKWAHLLSEAYSRSSVKGEEYEWVWQKVLLQPVIEESVGVEHEGCKIPRVLEGSSQ